MAEDTPAPSFVSRWRKAITASDLPPTCRHVLLTLALHGNSDGTRWFPSLELLAAETGLHRATVMRQLDAAEAAGWFTRTRSKGRGSHVYHPCEPSPSATVAENNRRSVRAQPSPSVSQPSPSARQPSHKTTLGSSEVVEVGVEVDTRDSFDAFWTAYPRKDDKAAARKAWPKAIRRAEPLSIIAAACRYRDDPNRDPGYTKLPATWLNKDSWENGPLPAKGGTFSRANANDAAAAQIAAAFTSKQPKQIGVGA